MPEVRGERCELDPEVRLAIALALDRSDTALRLLSADPMQEEKWFFGANHGAHWKDGPESADPDRVGSDVKRPEPLRVAMHVQRHGESDPEGAPPLDAPNMEKGHCAEKPFL